MAENVAELKVFYDSPAGHRQCRIIRAKITDRWRFVKKENIIGFGFTLPYLPLFSNENQTIALMPPEMGALDLHQGMPCVMADEAMLPLRNEMIDRIITAHALENITDPHSLIAEFWRVLKPYGRALFIFEIEKYDAEKLVAILKANKFYIMSETRAVADISLLERFTGKVLIVEAQKLVFAPRGRNQRVTKSLMDKLFKPKPAAKPQGV